MPVFLLGITLSGCFKIYMSFRKCKTRVVVKSILFGYYFGESKYFFNVFKIFFWYRLLSIPVGENLFRNIFNKFIFKEKF